MEKLKNYHYKIDIRNYITERFKIDKGVYNIKITLGKEVIIEEENLEYKNGKLLEKYIRKIIENYEKDLEANKDLIANEGIKGITLADLLKEKELAEFEEVQESINEENLEDPLGELEKEGIELDKKLEESEMEEAIDDVLNLTGETEVIEEINAVEIDAEEEVEEFEEEVDWGDEIDAIFIKRKSPIQMKTLFEKLDAEIKKLDGVIFKTTTLDLVYNINGRGFLRIRPLIKYLQLLIPPDYYKDKITLSEESEIDNTMNKIRKNYELIKEMTIKK